LDDVNGRKTRQGEVERLADSKWNLKKQKRENAESIKQKLERSLSAEKLKVNNCYVREILRTQNNGKREN
jgi:hypothetical protein